MSNFHILTKQIAEMADNGVQPGINAIYEQDSKRDMNLAICLGRMGPYSELLATTMTILSWHWGEHT